MRLLIFLAIIYLGYRALKSWMLQGTAQKAVFDKASRERELDDVMIQDPFCDVYFPQKDGVHKQVDGEDLYFCSVECRDKYVASRSKG